MKKGAADPRREVGGDPDLRAPPAGDWRKNKRKGRRLGRRGTAGWAAWAGLHACALAPEEKGRRPGTVCGLWVKEKKKRQGVGRLGQKREGKRGERFRVFLFFKKNSKLFFKLSNFLQTRNHAFES
jgi:hypothetical protein